MQYPNPMLPVHYLQVIYIHIYQFLSIVLLLYHSYLVFLQ
nr:MAG TPA: hypothetical protein [Bacteriophage sp.]